MSSILNRKLTPAERTELRRLIREAFEEPAPRPSKREAAAALAAGFDAAMATGHPAMVKPPVPGAPPAVPVPKATAREAAASVLRDLARKAR